MIKMKNILYVGLALLLCASCTKDGGNDFRSLPDAKISLQLKASGANKKVKAVTKASTETNELTGEAYINNITAFVFGGDNWDLVTTTPFYQDFQQTDPVDGVLTVLNIPAKVGRTRIVLVANAGSSTLANINTYASLEAALCQLAAQEQDNLTMSSQVIETEDLVAGDENYIGYSSVDKNLNDIDTPLELTRLAARLDIVSAKTNFTRPELDGRTVTIQSITVANQKTASRYFGWEYWAEVFAPDNLGTAAEAVLNLEVDNNTALSEIAYSKYVMENNGSEQPTELLITATLSGNDTYLAETRTFSAIINENGLEKYGHNFVKRNYVYKIALAFNNNSFKGDLQEEDPNPPVDPNPPIDPDPEPETPVIDIAISVAQWNTEVIDVPDIKN